MLKFIYRVNFKYDHYRCLYGNTGRLFIFKFCSLGSYRLQIGQLQSNSLDCYLVIPAVFKMVRKIFEKKWDYCGSP